MYDQVVQCQRAGLCLSEHFLMLIMLSNMPCACRAFLFCVIWGFLWFQLTHTRTHARSEFWYIWLLMISDFYVSSNLPNVVKVRIVVGPYSSPNSDSSPDLRPFLLNLDLDSDLGRFVTRSTSNDHCAHLQCFVQAVWHFANPYRTDNYRSTLLT